MDGYTAAIALKTSPLLLCNRAFAHLRAESYGSCLVDADAALALDPTCVKANYRRGAALVALGRHKQALADFRRVVALAPGDRDAKTRLEECSKAVRKAAFEAAISSASTQTAVERFAAAEVEAAGRVDATYRGPILPALPPADAPSPPPRAEALAADADAVSAHGMSLGFVRAMLAEFKAQRMISKSAAASILLRTHAALRKLPSLVRTTVPDGAAHVNVCGDTHGQFYDTLNIWEMYGEPSPTNPFVFNGDFVDRGSWGVENVLALFAWKLLYPEHVHLTRGNHESKNMNLQYGFFAGACWGGGGLPRHQKPNYTHSHPLPHPIPIPPQR